MNRSPFSNSGSSEMISLYFGFAFFVMAFARIRTVAEHRCQLVSEGRRKQRPHAERHSGVFHRKYLPAFRLQRLPHGISRAVLIKEPLDIPIQGRSFRLWRFMAWSEGHHSLPSEVAHMSLKKRRQVLRYFSLSKSASAFGKMSCPALRMAR